MPEPERLKGPPLEVISIGLPILVLVLIWLDTRRRSRKVDAEEREAELDSENV